MSLETSLRLYDTLMEKVSRFEKNLLSVYPGEIRCRKGCGNCCILESVFPVEAYSIRRCIEGIIRDGSVFRPGTGEGGMCVFLIEECCSVYNARPVICRTHGYPLMVDGRLDYCHENFSGVSSIDSGCILDLQKLNEALAAINIIFTRAITDEFYLRERIPLKEIADL